MPAYTFVDQADQILASIDDHKLIGVDTEFMREKTFFSQLCLLQLAVVDKIYCVDPLADHDMDEFWEMLMQRTWVLHSARQDIEVVFQFARNMPTSIFDTQIAAGLLGFTPQMGYAGLITELFDVELAKSHTRADWTQRPLPDEYLQYAAEDVEYLLPAYETLADRLEKKGRLDWARSDSDLMLDPALYDTDPSKAITRLKGAKNLRGRRRAAAVRLAAWRESEALRRNRPRQWILKDTILISIAYELPRDKASLTQIEELPKKVVQRAGDDILKAVADSYDDAHDYEPPARPDEQQKSLLKKMQSLVAECANDLGIAAETIASKKELSAIIIGGDRDSRVFNGWRRDLIGNQLISLL